jgi:RHH-type transcriptional regulator, proline utilization regulon repressor / proline dehydrogenase / delta 1-pyrroline-5-carboxylate dehydrogenase
MNKNSYSISKAFAEIASVRGKSQTIKRRRELAIALTALMLEEAQQIQTKHERKHQAQLARMMDDFKGKIFTTSVTDQSFRSKRTSRVADQFCYLINKWGVPRYLAWGPKFGISLFKYLGCWLSQLFVPLTKKAIRNETSSVILPGEILELSRHLKKRSKEGVRVNLNHLGEAILGEEEASRRLKVYLDDLKNPEVEYISVKISTICSQLNLLSFEETLEILSDRLKQLFRASREHLFVRPNLQKVPKFVNLDMEEYRDLDLTVELLKKVLDEPEFLDYSAGLVLQSYLPDSFEIQQKLTKWALARKSNGGASIKIRIVKGANLAMEKVEAALKGWPQAPYMSKTETDANFKRMVNYGFDPQHAQAVHLGIASHNLFDIAYALLLRSENQIEAYVCFEMLEGMADPLRRVVQCLSTDMLLYCPAATEEEFQNAVAYLIRRLDENTAPGNFLRDQFNLAPGTKEWQNQVALFSQACEWINQVSSVSRRTQNRFNSYSSRCESSFVNEPDTDGSLVQNREWAKKIILDWKDKTFDVIPLVINGNELVSQENRAKGIDPSRPHQIVYQYTLASKEQIDQALSIGKQISVENPIKLLGKIAQKLREKRADLIGAMIADTGKTIPEADVEVSEAIDFAEYYRYLMEELTTMDDLSYSPKGLVLVTPPWNFPCSIPAGGVLASLVTGNKVIFKPAPEAVLVGWVLAQVFWEAGVGKDVLQFINCQDDVGSLLVQDPRVSRVVLTGSTETAKLFMQLRPGIDLSAETGGKNAIIVTSMADRDLAIKDIIQSAFGHAGQKCSACSLAILEAEVYDDLHFRRQLRDAAKSWKVGSAWDLSTRLNPLIRQPNPTLLRGLTQLEEGEEWLLEPKQDLQNPHLWSPGIKLGVKKGSFTHQNELFGPVLGIMRAEDLTQAIELANATPYGLTAGLHSLDEREHQLWLDKIEAGNCYINRTITGAIVQRQPFGGCKDSSFGPGHKAGGPNYLFQFMEVTQKSLPKTRLSLDEKWDKLSEDELWKASLGSYAFYWKHYYRQWHDPSAILGQDNFLIYVPHKKVVFRIQESDALIDQMRVIAAAQICGTPLEVSGNPEQIKKLLHLPKFDVVIETEKAFISRLSKNGMERIRLISQPSPAFEQAIALNACHVSKGAVLANGRLELLHYLREIALSKDYHRYGYLGDREGDVRMETKSPCDPKACSGCCCLSRGQ